MNPPLGKLGFELYVVTGREQSRGRTHEEVVRAAIRGGAGCIQLRDKDLPKRELLREAYRLCDICAQSGVTFIINDHIDIALAVCADGVHLGQDDFPIREARRIVGPDFILGASTHSVEQALQAVEDGASYINVGPIFPTGTKKGHVTPVGPDLIRKVKHLVNLPMTTMGGINLNNVAEVVAAGADRVAVVSAVVGAEDVESAAREMVAAIRKARNAREMSEKPRRF